MPTDQGDDPQEFFPIMLGHVFKCIWSLDEGASFVTIEENDDSEPITSKREDTEYTVDALASYFSCPNPNCLNTELGEDDEGNEKRRPNIFASLLMDSALDMRKLGPRVTRKATATAARRVVVNHKILQFCETDMSMMFLGIHPLLPLDGITRIFVEILRIGLKFLKKVKDPEALNIDAVEISVRVMNIPFFSYENSGLLNALPSLPKYEYANKAIALEVAGPHAPVCEKIMESCSTNGVLPKAFGSTVYLLRTGRWGVSGVERQEQAKAMANHRAFIANSISVTLPGV